MSKHVKMKALGRQFSIGTLYNYSEDVIIPKIRLWDSNDVSRSAIAKEKRKYQIQVFEMNENKEHEEDTEQERGNPNDLPIFALNIDDHLAMSLTAGLVRPSAGAWQYLTDKSDQGDPLITDSQVAVYCHCSSRKVSIDPEKLDIVCHLERIVQSNVTHVVVAITYGLEAFCVFQPNIESGKETSAHEVKSYAEIFANNLSDSKDQVDLDIENESGGGTLNRIPLDCQCVLYSDFKSKKNEPDWTLKPVRVQYEECRRVLEHPGSKGIPLKIWLLPLVELKKVKPYANKIPTLEIPNISQNEIIYYRFILDKLQHTRNESELLIKTVEQQLTSNRITVPAIFSTNSHKINSIHNLIKQFQITLMKSLSQWIVQERRSAAGCETEPNLNQKFKSLIANSPFDYQLVFKWILHQQQEVHLLKTLSAVEGVSFEVEREQLLNHINHGSSYAVVLHLPVNKEGHSKDLHEQMKKFIEIFDPAIPSNWMNWEKEDPVYHPSSAHRRHIVTESREFAKWVTEHNSDSDNVDYFLFYDEEEKRNTIPFIRMYESHSDRSVSFKIPNAPGGVKVKKNSRGVITLKWTFEERSDQMGFLVQYRIAHNLEPDWACIEHFHPNSNSITIDYLESDETYLFRIAAITKGGKSPFGPISDEVTIDPVCSPPTQLRIEHVTDTFASITWYHTGYEDPAEMDDNCTDDSNETNYDEDDDGFYYKGTNYDKEEDGFYYDETKSDEDNVKDVRNDDFEIDSFLIECWIDNLQDSTLIQRTVKNTLNVTLESLLSGTTYCVQVRAICKDSSGSNKYSSATPILIIKTKEGAERAIDAARRNSKKSSIPSTIDTFLLGLRHSPGPKVDGVGHYMFGEPSYLTLFGNHRQRTILMLGATGSGKSTLINAMANYVLGVNWDDDFRFKLIEESTGKSQAHSQTDLVTTYDLYQVKGSRLDYALTVVDTPGFGDTRGTEKDKMIIDQLRAYFKSRHGVRQLEAVCFVVQSSLARLTSTQKYIFDSVLSIFGQDMKDSIRLMITFADGQQPPALEAVKIANIPSPVDPATGLPLHHKFNNAIFFESNGGDPRTVEFNQIYFESAIESFDRFFKDLAEMKPIGLSLTREVLEERKQLESLVEGLQMKMQMQLTRVDELQQVKKILAQNRNQMEANSNFEFQVEFLVPKSIDISGTGMFTTNCQKCQMTCHFPCRQSNDADKHLCSVIGNDGMCKICKCPWSQHFNQKYRYEMVAEKVKRSSDAIRKQYQTAVNETLTNQQLLEKIEKDVESQEKNLMELMEATRPYIKRLDQIALRPHSFSKTDYIHLMIATEKQEHRQGYQNRISTLEKLLQMEKIMNRVVRDYSENVPLATEAAATVVVSHGNSNQPPQPSFFQKIANYLASLYDM